MHERMSSYLGIFLPVVFGAAIIPVQGRAAGEEVVVPPAMERAASARLPAPTAEPRALEALASYRLKARLIHGEQTDKPEVTVIDETFTRAPRARQVRTQVNGRSATSVQIGDQTWMSVGDTVMQPAGAPPLGSVVDWLKPEALVAASGVRELGRETIQDIRTVRYELDLRGVREGVLGWDRVSGQSGQAWVADHPPLPRLVVRFELSWSQQEAEKAAAVQSSIRYEVYDINAPLTITPPAGASGADLPPDVPLYPGAEVSLSSDDMTAFRVADAMSRVADFYRAALAGEGWSLKAENDYEGNLVRQEWTKAERSLQVDILAQDAGSQVILRRR